MKAASDELRNSPMPACSSRPLPRQTFIGKCSCSLPSTFDCPPSTPIATSSAAVWPATDLSDGLYRRAADYVDRILG